MATLIEEQTSLAPPADAAHEDACEAAEATVCRDDYALGLLHQALCCLGQCLPTRFYKSDTTIFWDFQEPSAYKDLEKLELHVQTVYHNVLRCFGDVWVMRRMPP